MDEKTLGKRLQNARRQAGLTQQELCHQAGLSYSTLAKIERGAIASPSVFTVAAIAQATQTSMEELLGVKVKTAGAGSVGGKKISKSGVRFVYFDIGNTLVHAGHAFSEASRQLGLPADKIETVFWRHNDAACSGQLSLDKFNGVMAKELGVNSFDWRKYYMSAAEPIPGIAEFVGWVAEHYNVGLMSNNMAGFIDELIAKKRLPAVDYQVVIDSCKVGAVKPEAKIYELAKKQARVKPKEILLIDDMRPFLTAADQAGWQVLWFNDLHPAESLSRARKALEF